MGSQHVQLHLGYASDAKYVHIIEVAIASAYVLASRPNNLIIHVLDCGIPDKAWDAFSSRLATALPPILYDTSLTYVRSKDPVHGTTVWLHMRD